MNKKYIDFIPQSTKRAETLAGSKTAQKMPAVGAKSQRTPMSAVMGSGTVSRKRVGTRISRAPKKAPAGSTGRAASARRAARLTSTGTKVPVAATARVASVKAKTPAATTARVNSVNAKTSAAPAAQAKPKTSTRNDRVLEKVATKAEISSQNENKAGAGAAETSSSARPPFIRTENLDKRPLSGAKAQLSAVLKPIVEMRKTEPGKIITMTETSEPSSRLNFAIAVALTVILGATFGTVAFLLLPK